MAFDTCTVTVSPAEAFATKPKFYQNLGNGAGYTPMRLYVTGVPQVSLPAMVSVVGEFLGGTTGRISDQNPTVPAGYTLTAIRRMRDDPTGTLGVNALGGGTHWAADDDPLTTYRDFLNLVMDQTYTFTTTPVYTSSVGAVVLGPAKSVKVQTLPIKTVSIDITPSSGTTADGFSGTAIVKANRAITLDRIVIGTRLVGTAHTDPTTGDFALVGPITLAAGQSYTIPLSTRQFSSLGDHYGYVAWSEVGVWNRDLSMQDIFSVAEAPAPAPSTGTLPYAPPNVVWTEHFISNATSDSISFSAGTNNKLIYKEARTKRLQINGGHHLCIIGGEHNVNINNGGYYESAESYSVNGGIEPRGQTGTVFLEGLKVWGEWAMDAVRSSDMANADIVMQNCFLMADKVVPVAKNADGVPHDGVYHTDGFQCWKGPKSVKLYNVTIVNPYQAGMIGDGALKGADWGPTNWTKVNFRYAPTAGQQTRLINFVRGPEGRLKGPFTFKDVFYQPAPKAVWGSASVVNTGLNYDGGAFYGSQMFAGTDSLGRQFAQWDLANYPSVLGADDGYGNGLRVLRGLPPEGDYCPENIPGMGYVSPGYA